MCDDFDTHFTINNYFDFQLLSIFFRLIKMIFDYLLYLSVESLFSKQDMYTITITMPQEHIPVLFDSYSEVIVFTNTR